MLLKSRRVLELREAVTELRGDPANAMAFLPTLAVRANHPELTELFKDLVARADSETLNELLDSSDLQQRGIVEQRLAKGSDARESDVMAARNVGARPTDNRASVADPRGVGGIGPHGRRPSAGMIESSPSNATMKGPSVNRPPNPVGPVGSLGGRDLTMEGFPGQSIEQQLIMLMTRPDLTKEQIEAVFALIDGEYVGHPKKAWVLHMGERVLSRHVMRDFQVAYDHFLSPMTQHPERLITLVSRRSPRPPEVDEKIWQLVQSEDPEARAVALRYFVAPKGKADDYAMTMMRWVTEEPKRRPELSSVIARSSVNMTDPIRLNAFQWFLAGIEKEPSSPETEFVPPHLLRATSGALQVASRMRVEDQKLALPEILHQARFSKHSLQYVRVIDSLRCDRSDAVADLRSMMLSAGDRSRQLYIGNCLYRCAGHDDAVFKLCRDVLYEEPADWKLVSLAVAGLRNSGIRAKEHAARLMVLLARSPSSSSRLAIANLLSIIGPGTPVATQTVQLLMEHFPDTNQGYERRSFLKALGAFGGQAKEAVPFLLELFDSKDSQLRRECVSALAKIAPDDAKLRDQLLTLIGTDRSLELHLEREWKLDP